MKEFLCLNDIKPGNRARVKELTSTGSIRRRLLDIGLVENTEVECLGQSPLGDPCAYLIRGAVIAIRSEDCRGILVQPCTGFSEQGGNGGLHQPVRYLPKTAVLRNII